MRNEVTETEMLHRMASYCSTAERCVQDVRRKLAASGLTDEEQERILQRLEKEKFIDEARFARSFACDKFRFNKWGRRRIIMELSRKDIDRETIAEAMSVIKPEDYDSQLYNLLKTKAKTLKGDDPRADYARLLRFAGGRGFEQVDIHRCLRRLFNELPYEDYDMG